MKKSTYCIGVMSGTSLDGIDIAYIKFTEEVTYTFDIILAETIPYNLEWLKILKEAINFSEERLNELHISYGKLLGNIIDNFLEQNKISEVDFIASHGHTILHQPQKGITLQIGSGKEIAKITKHKVINDFRTQDVKLGGQGAPLVPIGDELLFSKYKYCINLGGFANVSYKKNNERIAFDICPVNIVLNHYCRLINLEFDNNGELASKGKIDKELLNKLNNLEFYKKKPPKSLGLEWVQKEVFPIIDSCNLSTQNILATFVEHAAIQISEIVKNENELLFTGGGVYNSYLIKRIENYASVKLSLPNNNLINFKEALIFGFLGLLKSKNEVNCLKSVTGATKNHSSGKIHLP